MRRIAAVLVVLTLVLGGLLFWRIRMQDRALHGPAGGSGEIEGTEIQLAAKISARIVQVAAREGATVKQGDLLLSLDCAEPQAMLAEAEARLAASSAQAQGAQAAAEAAQGALSAATASTSATRAQAAALQAQRDAAKRQADRLEAVGEDVAVSNRDQIRASATGLEHQLEAALASSAASNAQVKAAAAQARAALAQAHAAEANIRAAESGLARAKLLVAECEVRAPRAGIVESLPFEAGELVGPGAVLARIVDLTEVTATFYLPNAELAAAKPGAAAAVVADAYPGKQFKGVVRTVSAQAEFTPRNIQTRTDRDRLVYPVEVVIQNPGLELRAGMPVQVTLDATGK